MSKKAQGATETTVVGVIAQTEEVRNAKMQKVLERQAADDLAKKEAKAAKKAKSSKPGIIKTIGLLATEAGSNPISREEILDELELMFGAELNDLGEFKHTRETMSKTVTAQFGNKRPMRFERENAVVFDVTTDAEGNRYFGYSVEV